MIYEIEPLDQCFFRGPTPFEAGGETTVIHSIFPPLPSTYAGALRPLIKDEDKNMRSLKVGWNGVLLDNECWFPMPEDLYISSQGKDGLWNLERKYIRKKEMSNYPLDYMMTISHKDNHKPVKKITPYIREEELREYLGAKPESFAGVDINEKLLIENRIGIQIDPKSRVSKEQHIYTTMCVRPVGGMKLAVDIQGDLLNSNAVVRFGGEGKLARFSMSAHELNIEPAPGNTRYFKLYLATPAIFRNGWIPGWLNQESFTGSFRFRNKAVCVKLMCACVGRAVPCGGFSYVINTEKRERINKPRELRFAVPGGSVYYFKLLQGTYEDAVKLFHQKCISDYREGLGFDYQVFNRTRYCDRGFGYSLVGRLSREQEGLLHV